MSIKKAGEKLSHFIGRFVSSKREEKQFPDKSQRLAVAYSEAKEQAKNERKREK